MCKGQEPHNILCIMHYEALADSIHGISQSFKLLKTSKNKHVRQIKPFQEKNLYLYKLRLVLIGAIKIIDVYTAIIGFNVASVFVSGK